MTLRRSASGNAFVYILIAVILLGALSFALSKSNDSNPSAELTDASVKASVNSILAYEQQARTAIDRMIQNGASIAAIDYTLPSKSSFNTAPTINKLYHPDGGGLQWKPVPAAVLGVSQGSSQPPNGIYIGRFNNFAWTPTSAWDVVLTVHGVSKAGCEALNAKIVGSAFVPSIGANRPNLIDTALSGQTNADLTTSKCSACNGLAAFCVFNSSVTYDFYSILVAQ